jgi:orotidine-5'-phosphate decarboxylase
VTKPDDKLTPADSKDRLAVALDVVDSRLALDLVDRLGDNVRWFKIGMELYYAFGNSLIDALRSRGYKIFLDLKLHDIPNTVAGGVNSLAKVGADLLTVHAGGGGAMLTAAVEAANTPGAPRLLAVTLLTSMDAAGLAAVGVSDSPADQVMRLARLAKGVGITGLVCSADEVAALREELGPDALLVTPGIRPAGAPLEDQRRVATPAEAISRGASMLVVGRPITRAPNPADAARAILKEIESAMG